MESDEHYGEVFNIGSTDGITIGKLAERVKDACGSDLRSCGSPTDSEIVRIPYHEAYEGGFEDMARRIPDTSKLEQAIDWEPRRNLAEILGDVVAHHQGLALAPDSS